MGYDADNAHLTFSGYWVDVPGATNARFPPFTKRERQPAAWVDGAFAWDWDGVPAEARRHDDRVRELLSGRRHRVHGGIAVVTPAGNLVTRLVNNQVRFKRLDQPERERYLDSGEWQGKAGGYASQGLAASFIPWINGSYANVVGLPLVETLALLQGQGWRRP